MRKGESEALRKAFIAAAQSIRQANTPMDLKKAFRRAMLQVHPDKHQNLQALASNLSQKITAMKSYRENHTGAHLRPLLVTNAQLQALSKHNTSFNSLVHSTRFANSNYNDRNADPNYTYKSKNTGREYRTRPAYNNENIFRTHARKVDSRNDEGYEWIKRVNPFIFKKELLTRIPTQHRPCPPGKTRSRKKGARCRLKKHGGYDEMLKEMSFYRFGEPAGWVATKWGRCAIMTALREIRSKALRKDLMHTASGFGMYPCKVSKAA